MKDRNRYPKKQFQPHAEQHLRLSSLFLVLFNLVFSGNMILSAQSFPLASEPPASTPPTASQSKTAPTASAASSTATGSAAASSSSASASAPLAELPKSYRALSLGMSLEDLKKALSADDLFAFRGDRDVSLLPQSEQTLVETTGLSFIKRAFFQLKDGKVFIMAFTLNPDKIDHYSVFTTLVQKYGEPKELNPREAVWLSDKVRLSLERPLTVKYIDLEVFNNIVEASAAKESKEAVLRREFLNDF
uniref:Uncharacterized protein n=1 Tax=Gracilinema caldarium TaxID=215591 RepID=A0A7C3I2U8_9SPIR